MRMGLLDDILRIDGGCIVTGAQNGWIGDMLPWMAMITNSVESFNCKMAVK